MIAKILPYLAGHARSHGREPPSAQLMMPAESLTHRHRTLHFTRELDAIDESGPEILDVTLGEIG